MKPIRRPTFLGLALALPIPIFGGLVTGGDEMREGGSGFALGFCEGFITGVLLEAWIILVVGAVMLVMWPVSLVLEAAVRQSKLLRDASAALDRQARLARPDAPMSSCGRSIVVRSARPSGGTPRDPA
jgi:hypothetical protein